MELKEARVGDRIKCERTAPPRGSWKLYAGKEGTIREINRPDKEIGVEIDGMAGQYIWFYPSDLVRRPLRATRQHQEAKDG